MKEANKKKAGAKKSTAKKGARKKSKNPAKTLKPSAEERYKMVQEAAYYIAERNGFQGSDIEYWVQAEAQIARQLGETG